MRPCETSWEVESCYSMIRERTSVRRILPAGAFTGNAGLWPTKALGGDHRPCGRGCLQPSLPFIADDAGHCFDPLGVIVEAGAVLEVFAAGVGKDFAAFVTDLVERFQAIRREAR